jgi:hypothetical protein
MLPEVPGEADDVAGAPETGAAEVLVCANAWLTGSHVYMRVSKIKLCALADTLAFLPLPFCCLNTAYDSTLQLH